VLGIVLHILPVMSSKSGRSPRLAIVRRDTLQLHSFTMDDLPSNDGRWVVTGTSTQRTHFTLIHVFVVTKIIASQTLPAHYVAGKASGFSVVMHTKDVLSFWGILGFETIVKNSGRVNKWGQINFDVTRVAHFLIEHLG